MNFNKIKRTLGYKTKYAIADGAKEIWQKLKEGVLDPRDPRTITVKWYKYLTETQKLAL